MGDNQAEGSYVIICITSLTPSQIIHHDKDNPVADSLPGHERGNQYVGDVIPVPKPKNTTRLYFQNINGISLITPGTWGVNLGCHFGKDLHDMQVDLELLAEHKLNTTQP